LPRRKTFEARAVHEKNIEPAVVVVIVESDAAAGRFEQIFIFVLAAEKRFDIEASFFRDVDEADSEVARLGGRSGAARGRRCGGLLRICSSKQRSSEGEYILKRENQRGSAQRAKE